MYAVGHVYSEIISGWCGHGEPARMRIDVPHAYDLMALALEHCDSVGLHVQPRPPSGRNLLVEIGDTTQTLERRPVYGLCTLDDVQKATLALIDHIWAREGAGRIWFAGQPDYLLRRSENIEGFAPTRIEGREEYDSLGDPRFIPTGDGTRRVLIGAYYFHAPFQQHTRAVAKLRDLLLSDKMHQRVERQRPFTPAQRAAVSSHWSAQLRAKLAASAADEARRERGRIACDPRESIDLEDDR